MSRLPALPRHPAGLAALLVALLLAPGSVALPLLAAMLAWSVAGWLAHGRELEPPVSAGRASAEEIPLGVDARGAAVMLSDGQLSAHGLILGASGAGKSTTLLAILSERIRHGAPVVALDLKGSPEFAAILGDAARAAGRPFALWTPDGPGHWNPLGHGNPTELKDKLIATERFTEPHYQRAAERYVQTVLQVLREANPGRAPTLAQVVDAMDPDRLALLLRNLPSGRARRVQDYVASQTGDQLSAIRGLGTRLAILTESHTGAFLSPGSEDVIDLRRALAGEQVVLFSLNSSSYGKLASQLGTLVVQDLVSSVGQRLAESAGVAGQPGRRAVVAIDEFSALGADNVISLLARGRESRVSVLLATQELADLDRAAPGLRDQVLGNTALKLVHRQDVPASAHTIAQMTGTEKVWDHTYQLAGGILGRYDTSRGTRRQVEQFVVHPNEIRSLRTGHAVVIANGVGARPRTVRVQPPRSGRAGAER